MTEILNINPAACLIIAVPVVMIILAKIFNKNRES